MAKKKYNPEKVKLNAYEQGIEDSIHYKILTKPSVQRQKEVKAAAKKKPA